MRVCILLFLLFPFFISAQELNVIPRPVEMTPTEGVFALKGRMTVSSNFPEQDWPLLYGFLQTELKKEFGITLVEVPKGSKADISFEMTRMPTSGQPAYKMNVSKSGIAITANFSESAFNAIQTIFQLIPTDPKIKKEIPGVQIFDYPRFQYRGIHLDVGRHFFSVEFIKRYIDYLAYYKFNYFHWHLTEDQGWRIEIKKYPKLTEVGAWRNGTIIGRYPGTGNDNKKYGGFYTQKEVNEIVKYASDHFITIIPEIEMPGHSSAAIAAYPYLSCFPDEPTKIPATMISNESKRLQEQGQKKLVQETWGVHDDVFCAGKEETFKFLEDVLDEVIPLFPSKYVHIGGDECPKANWKRCPNCQKRMKDNSLKDEHELQSYFIQRIEKYINNKGKTLIGWDEILEGGLAPNAVVMSWRGEEGGIAAAKENHYVIMTPGSHVYFDHSQSEQEDSVVIGGYTPIEKVYSYEPIPAVLNDQQGKYVLGAQANLWTEYMGNPQKVEYMLFPRIAALSEVLWTPKDKRNWSDFEKRLLPEFRRFDLWKTSYSKAYFDLRSSTIPNKDFNGVLWKLETKHPQYRIKFIRHFAGRPYELSFAEGETYSSPVEVTSTQLVSAANMVGNRSVGYPAYQQFLFNKATGKKITLKNDPDKAYPGDGAFTLVNGIQNEKGIARQKEFLGFKGTDCEAAIDLGKVENFSKVTVHFLKQERSWIWQPASAEVFVSSDGTTYKSIGLTDDIHLSNPYNGTMTIGFNETGARFVKVFVKNWGTIPAGNPGEGNKAWLFIDEIEIN